MPALIALVTQAWLAERRLRGKPVADLLARLMVRAHRLGAEIVELHTGAFANATGEAQRTELVRIHEASVFAHGLGVQVNAGHGINYTNIALIRTVPHLAELNIGHSIVARAVFSGLDAAVRDMLAAMKI